MSQAESHSISRRSLLRGVAALPIGGSAVLADTELRAMEPILREVAARLSVACAAHSRAEAAHFSAGKRDRAQSGVDDTEAKLSAVIDEMSELWERAVDMRATSMDGVFCKARIAALDRDNTTMAASIVHDLLALAAA